MAKVPLNLRKFLPKANIARNSKPGMEGPIYARGAIIFGVLLGLSAKARGAQ